MTTRVPFDPDAEGGYAAIFDRWEQAVRALARWDDIPPSLFNPPSTELDIERLEARLGVRLPPSYRSFLRHTNGARAMPGWGYCSDPADGLLDTGRVAWLRDMDRFSVDLPGDAAPDGWDAFDPPSTERAYLLQPWEAEEMEAGPKAGHLAYALAISTNIDGYQVLLNPLVLDGDGEWEALDYGTKTLGGRRHPSFAAFLATDGGRTAPEAPPRDGPDADELVAAATGDGPIDDRLAAAWRLLEIDDGSVARPAIAAAGISVLRGEATPDQRWTAARLLPIAGTHDARAMMRDLLHADDWRLANCVIGSLANSDDPADRAAALDFLVTADPEVMGFSLYYGGGADVLYEAYRRNPQPGWLVELARLHHAPAAVDVAAALLDPTRLPPASADQPDPEFSLSTYATALPGPDIRKALLALVERRPVLAFHIGRSLAGLSRYDTYENRLDIAVPMLLQAALAEDGPFTDLAVEALGQADHPTVAAALRKVLEHRPGPEVCRAIGWHPSGEAVSLLAPLVEPAALARAAIDGLERMRTPEADDALARRAAGGEHQAARALARRSDRRALEPLLAMLVDADPRVARAGADGLRDLRDPGARPALLEASRHPDPDVAVIATHALVCQEAPQVPEACANLDASADPAAGALAERWMAAWRRRR